MAATTFLYPPTVTPPSYVERTFNTTVASSSQGGSLRQESHQKVQALLQKILKEALERTEKSVMVTGAAHRIKLASSAYEKEHQAKIREMSVVRALVEKILSFDPFKEFDHLVFSKAMDVALQRCTFSKDLLNYTKAYQHVILENCRHAGEHLEVVEQKLSSHKVLSGCLEIANTPSIYDELEEKVSTFLVECSDAGSNILLQRERFKSYAFKNEDVSNLWMFNRSLCEQFLARLQTIESRTCDLTTLKELRQLAGNEFVAVEGNPIAQLYLGKRYYHGTGVDKDFFEAARNYRLSADQGNALAQSYLGFCYQKGKGVDKSLSEALRFYRMSAEQGCASGQYNLGSCYYDGAGVEKNQEEAVRYFRMSAEQGHASAQNNLGHCYLYGFGVEKCEAEGLRLFRMCAEQGDSHGQCNLANCYEKGLGVEKNEAEAIRYFRLSAAQGVSYSKNELDKMLKKV